ncbi:MAG: hypothetical protein EOO66_05440, partial [Methylobacterium sp.]
MRPEERLLLVAVVAAPAPPLLLDLPVAHRHLRRAQIGDQQELYSEFYQPLDIGSRYFVAPYLDLGSQNIEATLE